METHRSPAILSFVAKSGTGKTTLLEALIPLLRARGLRVGVLKHHHYTSSFDTPGKDTYRLAAAGADIVVGASPVQVAVFTSEDGSANIDRVIAERLNAVDLVLIEGYKRGSYPKIEVHRASRSDELLCDPDELLAIVSNTRWDIGVPELSLDDVAGTAEFILAWVRGR